MSAQLEGMNEKVGKVEKKYPVRVKQCTENVNDDHK